MTHSELKTDLESLRDMLQKAAIVAGPGKRRDDCARYEKAVGEAVARLSKREKRIQAGDFIPPSESEVEAEMNAKGLMNGTAAEQAALFVAHHAARGWRLGKGLAMVSWQRAVVTWVSNFRRFNAPKASPRLTGLERSKAMGIG